MSHLRTPPTPEREEYDDYDDPWYYATEYDYIHRNDVAVPASGIAHHVHNVFENLRDNMDEITSTLGGSINVSLLQMNYHDIIAGLDKFFLILMSKFYSHSKLGGYENLNDEGKLNYNKLIQIMEKLELSGDVHLTFDALNNIFTWIQYVLRQPDSFQQHYLDCFIRDTFNAYDGVEVGEGGNISCPKGIYERLLFAIGDACVLYCSQYKKKKKPTRKTKKLFLRGGANKQKSTYQTCDKPVYRKLIRLLKKEVPDMNELTKEWSGIFDTDFVNTLSTSQLKQHFIEFMDRKYKLYGLDEMKTIQARANELEAADIFKNKTF